MLLASATAGQLLEPFRVELEDPVLEELTPLSVPDVALEHLIAPIGLLVAAGALAVLGAAAIGGIGGAAVPAALVATVGVAVLLVGASALTSTRGAPPLHFLLYQESGVMLLAGWVLAGPLLAVAACLPLALGARNALQSGVAPMQAVLRPSITAVALGVALALASRWRAEQRLG